LATLGARRYYLAGNGAMLEEMTIALPGMRVDHRYIYEEPYFTASTKTTPMSSPRSGSAS
jgi:hypothetical protein